MVHPDILVESAQGNYGEGVRDQPLWSLHVQQRDRQKKSMVWHMYDPKISYSILPDA